MNAPVAAPLALDALAHKLAESAARSDIECYCVEVLTVTEGNEPPHRWYDTHQVPIATCEQDRQFVAEALQYLEARGLLIRRPAEPHIVSFAPTEAP